MLAGAPVKKVRCTLFHFNWKQRAEPSAGNISHRAAEFSNCSYLQPSAAFFTRVVTAFMVVAARKIVCAVEHFLELAAFSAWVAASRLARAVHCF